MGDINNIVRVNIRRGTRSVTRAGFGVPLVFGGPAVGFSGIRTYQSLSEVAEDFSDSDAEYLMASRLFSQEIKPSKIKIRGRSANVAQVVTITPTAVNETSYQVTINGTQFTFLSDEDATVNEIVAGLISAINGGTEPVTASGTTTLILTSDVAGIGFTYSVGANLVAVITTPNTGIVSDLNAANEEDKDWYGVLMVSRSDDEAFLAANWTETQRKMFYYSSASVDIKSNAPGNIAARMKAASFTRTLAMFSDDADIFAEGSWAGDILPRDPGSYTAKFKTLNGVTPDDDLTSTEEQNIKANNFNTYTTTGGVAITAEGKTPQGEFADTIRFVDWLQAQIEENIYSLLVSVPKVPFTDPGVGLIENIIRQQLQRGVQVGGLAADPEPVVSVPKVANVPILDRADRTLPDVTFNATLAGAIHFVRIDGVVSV